MIEFSHIIFSSDHEHFSVLDDISLNFEWYYESRYYMGHSNKIAFTNVLFAPSDKSWSIFIFCVWVVVSQCVCIYIIELFATKLTANILLSFFNMFHKQKSVQDIVECYLEYTSQAVQKQAMKRCKFWWWTQSKNYFFQLCNNTWYAVFGFSPFIQIFKYIRPGPGFVITSQNLN